MIHTYLRPLLRSLWCFRSWPSVCSCTLEFRIFSNHDFLSSRLPSCRIPSCWMDGIHATCLSTGQKVVTESLRKCNRRPHRSSSRFLMGQGNYTLTTAYCHPFWWRFSHRFWELSCHWTPLESDPKKTPTTNHPNKPSCFFSNKNSADTPPHPTWKRNISNWIYLL